MFGNIKISCLKSFYKTFPNKKYDPIIIDAAAALHNYIQINAVIITNKTPTFSSASLIIQCCGIQTTDDSCGRMSKRKKSGVR